jgi:hypothetical protein
MAREKRPPEKPFAPLIDKDHAGAVSYSHPPAINNQAWQQTAKSSRLHLIAYQGKIASRRVPMADSLITRRAKTLRKERRWNVIAAEIKAMKSEAEAVSATRASEISCRLTPSSVMQSSPFAAGPLLPSWAPVH